MYFNNEPINCGVWEFEGLGTNNAENIFKYFVRECPVTSVYDEELGDYRDEERYNLFLFSSGDYNGPNTGAKAFYDFIREKKLGTVKASKIVKNPNHDSKIQVFMWTPNWKAVDKLYEEMMAKKPPKPKRVW